MKLAEYKAASREVQVGEGSFHVKGLSLDDLSVLVSHHLEDLEALFDVFENAEKLGGADWQKIAAGVIAQAPGFAANVIALGAGETDTEAVRGARALPFPVQLEAFVAIGDLTFTEVGSVKKFLETVAGLLGRVKVPQKIQTMLDTAKAE